MLHACRAPTLFFRAARAARGVACLTGWALAAGSSVIFVWPQKPEPRAERWARPKRPPAKTPA